MSLRMSLTGRLISYAKLLYLHLHQIELLESEFDKIVPILLQLSDKERNAVFDVSYG
jgi:hypothetical protein